MRACVQSSTQPYPKGRFEDDNGRTHTLPQALGPLLHLHCRLLLQATPSTHKQFALAITIDRPREDNLRSKCQLLCAGQRCVIGPVTICFCIESILERETSPPRVLLTAMFLQCLGRDGVLHASFQVPTSSLCLVLTPESLITPSLSYVQLAAKPAGTGPVRPNCPA